MLTLQPLPGVDGIRALRGAEEAVAHLRDALRRYPRDDRLMNTPEKELTHD